jgi:type I restriction enzyme R subunit
MIGRGTRVFEPKGKMWFTIIDYRKATRLFKDEEWDGPAEIETEEELEKITKEKETKLLEKAEKRRTEILEGKQEEHKLEESIQIQTYHIEGNKVEIRGESVLIFDQSINGNRLISYQDYTGEQVRRLVNDEQKQLYKIWTEPEKRKHFVDTLQKRGITFAHLREVTQMYKADAFDLLLHFAFNSEAKTRLERADRVRKKAFLEKYPEKARVVLEVILNHYAEEGYQELEGREILDLQKFKKFGGPIEIINNRFGNGEEYDKAMIEITKALYSEN